jgi:exopolysaccharide biosynthesis polyprenyl glycosylphosphotransferase
VGFVDDQVPREPLSAPFLGGLDVPARLGAEGRITEVLVAREDLSRGDLVELAHGWTDRGLRVTVASSTFEVMVARASGEQVGGVPLAELRPSRQQGAGRHLKRIFDITAVSLGGLLLLPVLIAVAVAVRLTSPGPVLFRQERIGRGGRPFTMLKFRSMVVGNDDQRHREYVAGLMKGNQAGVDGVFKLVDDPRVTRIGAFLRRASLDELPQLWNVLRGDMSLVGPRPCLPYEWEMYRDWQRRRLDAAPGLTGLWQVAGRSRVPFEDMVLLDLHYIANWSFRGDLALLARTVPVVVAGSGGH